MKRIVTWFIVGLVCLGLGYAGKLLLDKEFDSPFRTTIAISDDGADFKLNAKYPIKNSAIIAEKLKSWTAQAIAQTGNLGNELQLKFSDGSNCRVHAKGRDLEISASKRTNNAAQLDRLKLDYKTIHDFIVSQAKEKQKK